MSWKLDSFLSLKDFQTKNFGATKSCFHGWMVWWITFFARQKKKFSAATLCRLLLSARHKRRIYYLMPYREFWMTCCYWCYLDQKQLVAINWNSCTNCCHALNSCLILAFNVIDVMVWNWISLTWIHEVYGSVTFYHSWFVRWGGLFSCYPVGLTGSRWLTHKWLIFSCITIQIPICFFNAPNIFF